MGVNWVKFLFPISHVVWIGGSMKFATVSHDGRQFVAVLDEEGKFFWPVSEAYADLPADAATDMVRFIAASLTLGEPGFKGEGTPLRAARLLAPIPSPRRDIMCVGKNYYEHAREFTASGYDSSAQSVAQAVPSAPIIFGKSADSVIASNDDILMFPGVDDFIDYEAELAVVIGKPGRGISKADALDHVFGYTLVNDVTARDLQDRHKQWYLAKSLDTACPMGPVIVTADALDLETDKISCWVDGELRQDALLKDMIFDIPTLIETISAGIELKSGDIIATGTPAGVGIGFKPPRFLKDGNVVEMEVPAIGRLSNTVRRAPAGETA
jgi:2-keto-4-pentenoate hydratase/2-oxohepta-3-ene-1,7-dioic acid hydratase in catechol pathway